MMSDEGLINGISELQAQLNEVFVHEAETASSVTCLLNEHAENGNNGCSTTSIRTSRTDDAAANGYHVHEAKDYSKNDHSATTKHSDGNRSNGNGNSNRNHPKIKDKNGPTDKLSKILNLNAVKNSVNGTSS